MTNHISHDLIKDITQDLHLGNDYVFEMPALNCIKKTMVKVTRHVHVTVPIIIAKDKTLVILTYLFQNMLLKLLMKLYW